MKFWKKKHTLLFHDLLSGLEWYTKHNLINQFEFV